MAYRGAVAPLKKKKRSSPIKQFRSNTSDPGSLLWQNITGASSRSGRGLKARRTARLPSKLTSEASVPARERTGSLTDARISSHRSIFQNGSMEGGDGTCWWGGGDIRKAHPIIPLPAPRWGPSEWRSRRVH
ncbi:hypothetical protein CEXT_430151 [Caerostris extrusa]|uniref:Uncharacterized protein n=1 Tax=Caerostris extrusa TaxID=172846 RepID=A0AAV4U5A9_CAEEX|nr:hypothetical protein CEXT_430151 [Caerostris extrusa]